MKVMCYKSILSALFCLSALVGFTQTEQTKSWKKSFELPATGSVYIENKFGDVVIKGWDKNELMVAIQMSVTHRKAENAEKLLERIQPEARAVGDFVRITSEISDKNSGFFTRYFNKANPFDLDKSNVKIDYEVYLPESAELNVINKFGDLIVGGWNGDLEAEVQHGDVWINENLSSAKLDMRFGKLRVRSLGYGNLKMKNGNMDIESATKLRINSSGSEIKIDRVEDLEYYSSKDEAIIESVDVMRADLKFTTLQLNGLAESFKADLKVADVVIGSILNAHVVMNIAQQDSDIDVNIEGTSFVLDAVLEQGMLRLPKSFSNIDTELLDKSKKLRKIQATYGEKPEGNVTLTGMKGSITFKE